MKISVLEFMMTFLELKNTNFKIILMIKTLIYSIIFDEMNLNSDSVKICNYIADKSKSIQCNKILNYVSAVL